MTPAERIYAVVRRIPRGRVATYGQVAQLAGLARQARQVGYALNRLADDGDVPWHRVINARGEISPRAIPDDGRYQRILLTAEGIRFSPAGRVDLDRHLWKPVTRPHARPRDQRT
jgi:methylated-DNA-protein-cysteine methyltransferase related protein